MGKRMNNIELLTLRMRADAASGWNYLLQKGFFLRGRSGMSVREFLNEVIGYNDRFIDETVRTIFRNNSPVDDIDNVFIQDGDRMALGSAMPGIFGIVMGRDNPYKSFRSDISARDDDQPGSGASISVLVKIFSTLAVDTGVDVLGRGIQVEASELAEFLEGRAEQIIDTNGMDGDELVRRLHPLEGKIKVCVIFE